MKPHPNHACLLATLACGAALSAQLNAASLGSIRISSALGDRFNAWVSVSLAENEHISPACFQLVTPHETSDVKILQHAQIDYRNTASGGEAHITGQEYEREPLLRLALQLRCPEDSVRGFTREYNVLLDPREYQNPAPAKTHITASTLAEVSPVAPSPRQIQPASLPVIPPAMTYASLSENTEKPRRKPRKKAPPPIKSVDEFRLQLSSTTLDPAHAALQLSDAEKTSLRERLLLIESDDQSAQLLQLKDRVSRLEKQLAHMQTVSVATAPIRPSDHLPQVDTPTKLLSDEPISNWSWAGLVVLLLIPLGFLWQRKKVRQQELLTQFEFDTEQDQSAAVQPGPVIPAPPLMRKPLPPETTTPSHNDGWGNEYMDVVSPDTIAEEAQLFLAHGLTQQAIDLLLQEITFRPNSLALWMKLFAIYHDARDPAGFEKQACAFRKHFVSEALWKQVQALGHEIDADNPLYLAPESPITIDTPQAAYSGNDDFDIVEIMGREKSAQSDSAPLYETENLLFPLDFERPAPLHSQDHALPVSTQKSPHQAEDTALFSFDIPSLELPIPELSGTPQAYSEEDFSSTDTTLQDIAQTILNGQPEQAYQQLEELLYRGSFEQRLTAAKWLDKLLPVKG